jgi:hypothetical protein
MILTDYTLITPKEYLNLIDPEFIGQTRIDNNGVYYMCWKSNGLFYKTKNVI